MKLLIVILLTLFVNAGLHEARGQRIMVVQSTEKFKSFKYFVGDEIILKTKNSNNKIRGTLEGMTDSSIFLDLDKVVMLKDIGKINRQRYWFRLLSKVTAIAGVGYFALDVTNNLLTGNPTVVSENTLITSGSILAFSAAMVPFHNRHIRIGNHWRIMVLNMDLEGEVPNPFQR